MTGYASKGSTKYYGKRLVCETCAWEIDKREHDKNRRNNIIILVILVIIAIRLFPLVTNLISTKLRKDDFQDDKINTAHTTNGLNMRAHPTKYSTLLISIPKNTEIDLLKSRGDNFENKNWARIEYKNREGYVLKKYLEEN
ncbi:SH3 domain-containing protein [Flavobacterium psychrophilum]|nr:SH3 domain-containing protein [Flavobacterium psychrophilum]MBF2044330.1 SH3 domain-containing protein [Flavobacterium psychrophilum]